MYHFRFFIYFCLVPLQNTSSSPYNAEACLSIFIAGCGCWWRRDKQHILFITYLRVLSYPALSYCHNIYYIIVSFNEDTRSITTATFPYCVSVTGKFISHYTVISSTTVLKVSFCDECKGLKGVLLRI